MLLHMMARMQSAVMEVLKLISWDIVWWEWESRAVGLPSMSLLETMQGFLNIPAYKTDTKVSKCPCSTEPQCCSCGYTTRSLLQEWLLQS